jgi:hypothetical protein
MAAVVLALALVRNLAGLHEDDQLHLSRGSEALITQQVAFFGLLGKIERWGKSLTIATVLAGVALAAVYLYQTILMDSQIVR